MQNTRWYGLLRSVFQAGWLALTGLLLATFAAGVPVRFNYLMQPPGAEVPALFAGLEALEAVVSSSLGPQEVQALASMGLSQRFYAGYILAFEVALVLGCTLIGIFIFWQRPNDWLTLWISFILVLLGTNGPIPVVSQLSPIWPRGYAVSFFTGLLGMISNLHILFLSPDGRFVPRWTFRVAAGFTGAMLALCIYVAVATEGWGMLRIVGLLFVAFPIWFGLIGLGIFSQIYRYLRVSGPVQRQQTKWVAIGLAAIALGFALNAYFLYVLNQQSGLSRVQYTLIRMPVVVLCLLFLPVCLAFSILRYRLWDIDLIIRRTLIYSSLTAVLALIYISSVVLLQALFRALTGERQSEFVTVISTLAIATLFVRLRWRVQNFIDRRFYRKKYDVEQILAVFSQSLRNEVELENLTSSILERVEETMQPAQVSLWLSNGGLRLKEPQIIENPLQISGESIE